MSKSIESFKVLTCFLNKLRTHQLIALDQLQSEKYLNDCRKRLFAYCYWREIIGFKNYVTLELFKEAEKPTPEEERFIEYEIEEIYFTKNFAPLYNVSPSEHLTKIKPITETITHRLMTDKDYYINDIFEKIRYLKNQRVTFLDFSDHTFSFRNIPSPLYRLSCQYNKVKKSIDSAFKDDLHRFHQNIKVETTLKNYFEKDVADYILKNIDFYNSLFCYGRTIFLTPANDDSIINSDIAQIIEDTYLYTKKLTFLSEDYTKIHRKRLKESLYFYKELVNKTSEQKAYNLVKTGYQLSQCYIRLEIILIQLSLIRFLKFSLINCDPTLVKLALFDNLSGENKYVYFNNKKISLDSFNDFSHSSVKRNKQILEKVLEEEKLRFTQLFNDLMRSLKTTTD